MRCIGYKKKNSGCLEIIFLRAQWMKTTKVLHSLGFTVILDPFFLYICDVCNVGRDKEKDVYLQSFRRVCSNLDLHSSFSCFFYIYIYFSRKRSHSAQILKNAPAPQQTACQISCITIKIKSILAIIFQLWNILLKSCDYNFSCYRTLCTPLLLPYAALFCSSATLWIAKPWMIFLTPNCLLLDITSPSYNCKGAIRVFRLHVGLPVRSLVI